MNEKKAVPLVSYEFGKRTLVGEAIIWSSDKGKLERVKEIRVDPNDAIVRYLRDDADEFLPSCDISTGPSWYRGNQPWCDVHSMIAQHESPSGVTRICTSTAEITGCKCCQRYNKSVW